MYRDDVVDSDESAEDMDNTADEVDDMLDALMESDEEADLTERIRRRPRARRGTGAMRWPAVRMASDGSAYRAPAQQGYVTQGQLREALGRVGTDVRRNAQGIKTVNSQLGRLTDQVKGVVSVNSAQNARIRKLDKQMQIDGALDLAASFEGGSLNAFQLLKGAVKSGVLGEPKGPLGNPVVVGAIGFLLNNNQILRGLIGGAPAVPGP
jgi:hypothetical protein